MGYVAWIDTYEGNPDPKKARRVQSQIVEELVELGAIVYCKVCFLHVSMCGDFGDHNANLVQTSVPQTLLVC